MATPAVRRSRILVMEDEPVVRQGLRRFLESKGFEVEEAVSCRQAEEAFQAMPPDAAILDHGVTGGGAGLVPRLKALSSAPLIVLAAHGSIEGAARAIQEGAEQFLTKPVELPALERVLQRALEDQRNRQKQMAGRSRQAREAADPFLGESPAIRRLAEEAARAVGGEGPVLIEGESGTGKGALARWLHVNGPRWNEPFVDLWCAGLPSEALEAELFGQEEDAAAGPDPGRLGLLEVAHRGTLFLDEIGDLDPAHQARLLAVLEERRFRRRGGMRHRHVDVRLLAATHRLLAAQVERGRFRPDLFHLISAVTLSVPALRERLEDIPVLARCLLERCAAELGRPGAVLSDEAMAALRQHHWPGNLRELRNVLERALLLAEGDQVRERDLRLAMLSAPAGGEGVLPLTELERRGIERALAAEAGHVGRAAQRLGVPRSSLYKKIKRYGLGGAR